MDQWFDRKAFPAVPLASYRFGSSGRNILDGPGTFALNLKVSRQFKLAEATAMELRAESFNLANHANFGLPVTDLASPGFGRILEASPSRLVQFGLKFLF